jgi:gliding motility-associated-like protein
MKKIIGILIVLVTCFSSANGSHIVGGDVHFEQTGPNTFNITLEMFRDWCNASFVFDPTVNCVIRDNSTDALIQNVTLTRISLDSIVFGDECYTPQGICNEVSIYSATVNLPNNPNGYYLAYATANRNSIITNINSSAGKVWYAQIPDPAISGMNSSPKWGTYPTDGYLCIGNVKLLDMSCTDSDGDSLVYSLVNPTNNSTTKPFNLAAWNPSYNLSSILGPGSLMIIDPVTGIVSARPGTAGVYVFAVRCVEYRNGGKIGEVEIDMQYEALNCTYDQPPSFPPYPSTAAIEFDDNVCFDIVATDPNPTDTFYIKINSNSYPYGAFLILPTPNVSPAGSYTFTYIDTNTGSPASLTTIVNQIDDTTFQGVGSVGARFCWNPYACDVLAIDTFKMDILAYSKGCDELNDTLTRKIRIDLTRGIFQHSVPNVFSPNNDSKNDVFSLEATQYDRCYDLVTVAIYNRWGIKVFESEDPLFKWDGTDTGGTEVNEGTYYVILQGFFGGREVTDQFPLTLFK